MMQADLPLREKVNELIEYLGEIVKRLEKK